MVNILFSHLLHDHLGSLDQRISCGRTCEQRLSSDLHRQKSLYCDPVLDKEAYGVGKFTCARPSVDLSAKDHAAIGGYNQFDSLLVSMGKISRMSINTR